MKMTDKQYWNKAEAQQANAELGQVADDYSGVMRSQGSLGRTFLDIDTNVSVRSEYGINDYDYYRRGESVPTKQIDIIRLCMKAYDKVGLIRNTIDLMSEFASQGIKLVHPNKNIQAFYQKWFEHVNGPDVSERLVNYVLRSGQSYVKRKDGKINQKKEKEWRKANAELIDTVLEEMPTNKRVIPLQYNFLNPLSIDVIGAELAVFIGKPIYVLKITHLLSNMLKGHLTPTEQKSLLKDLPNNIKDALKSGKQFIVLDQDKLTVFHYKKDDWLPFANPMVYPVLSNLVMLEKMHLADMSALDGAISNIRLWNLGVLDGPNSIIPTRNAINRLRNILSNNITGGVLDLVWGPELTFSESSTQVHNFLGADKYQQVMSELYEGIGIPPNLTGSGGGGFTNNFISMQTLMKRLQYLRCKLIKFWTMEIKRVQKGMGFRFPAKIQFERMILTDEAAEQKLVLDLIDRDLISAESALDRFDFLPNIEKSRIRREQADRLANRIPPKAGPYHNPQTMEELKKIVLQRGGVAPSEVGLELLDKKEGEQSAQDQMSDMQIKIAEMRPKGVSGEGRPKNTKDSTKRKKRTDKPRTSAEDFVSTFIWANDAQKKIADISNPAILDIFKRKNMRSLNAEEKAQSDYLNFSVLSKLDRYEDVTPDLVYNILLGQQTADTETVAMCKVLSYKFQQVHEREPTIDELKQIQSSAYALQYEEI